MRMQKLQIFIFLLLLVTATFTTATCNAAPNESVVNAPCDKFDDACVLKLKNIASIKLMAERESLAVDVERTKLKDFQRTNDHKIWSLWGQYIATWIVLLLVIGIVIVGLLMSWKQMVKDIAAGTTSDNTFELGKDGLKIRSPVIGLIIFIASIYFFSVYVDKIYTITILKEDTSIKAAQPENKSESK